MVAVTPVGFKHERAGNCATHEQPYTAGRRMIFQIGLDDITDTEVKDQLWLKMKMHWINALNDLYLYCLLEYFFACLYISHFNYTLHILL